MAGADHGLSSAVGALIDAHTGENPEAAPPALQLPLLPADQVLLLPSDPQARREALRGPRGPGRPVGARNRRTLAFAEFLLSRYPDPVIGMAETYSRPVGDLAEELNCTRYEAYQIQLRCKVEVAPYVHGKMPVAVDLTLDLPTLELVDPRAWAALHPIIEAAAPSLADLQPIPPESEENQ